MRNERKFKLEVNKVNVSKLNMLVAGDGSLCTVGACISEFTVTCDTKIDGHCFTYITAAGSRDRC